MALGKAKERIPNNLAEISCATKSSKEETRPSPGAIIKSLLGK